jgi:hypothetical protein
MRTNTITTIIIAAMALAQTLACDQQVDEPVDEPVAFRGMPEVLYLTQHEAEVDLQAFAKMVVACNGIEKVKLATTWSAYPWEDPTNSGTRVLGFGFSTMAHDALIECYEDLMLEMGAHP